MFKIITITFTLTLSILLSANETTHRTLQFENDKVKVWKTTIMPNQPLKMHRHDSDRVIVGLEGGELTKIEEDGKTSPLVFESSCAYWLDKDPIDELHADINKSSKPIEVMVIEVKD